ncbi:MAG TPA: hypothetical protein VIM31_03430 [Candidatus Microsaccharimonas sp.]
MSETSKKFNHNYHIQTAIDTEAPAVSGGIPPAPEVPKSPNKKRRNIVLGAVGIVAAGALAATLAVGLNSGNQSKGEQPPKATETSAPADPTATEAPAPATGVEAPALTGEALTQAFTMPENLSGDELAKTFVLKVQNWGQYGENIKTQDGTLGYSADILESQSQAGGQTIAEALISSEHITSPLMSKFVTDHIQENIAITDAWAKTYFPDKSKNPFPYVIKEAFNQTLEFNNTSNVSTDEATGVTTMDIHFTQMTDLKNTVDPTLESTINPNDEGFARNNVSVVWRVEFVHENGSKKVQSVIVQPQE